MGSAEGLDNHPPTSARQPDIEHHDVGIALADELDSIHHIVSGTD
jgi:hypothetical protein